MNRRIKRGQSMFFAVCARFALTVLATGICTVPRSSAAAQIGPWRGASPLAGGVQHSLGLKSDGRISAWGDDSLGQTNVPEPNANFVAVAAGGTHSLGLKSDGHIEAWGDGACGQTNVPEPSADFIAVAAGGTHSLGLKSNGSIAAWGDGACGQTNVPEPNADFIAVAAGGTHSLGLTSNGTIVAWGDGARGQTNVPEPNTGFIAVAAGGTHSLGLTSNGTIVAWGDGACGQTNVPEPNAGFIAVAAGGNHSLGLKSNGSIVAWGSNDSGQTNVPLPNAQYVAVAAGGSHSLGLRSDGRIIAWGWSEYGQTNVAAPNSNFGQRSGVVPPKGTVDGGTTVTILGSDLSSGSDVTNVVLCGVAATIVTQTPRAVVVQTGPAPGPTCGSVVVWSTAYGSATRTNAFTYIARPTVLTRSVTNITTTSAAASGEVLSDGGDPVVERGLCWGSASDPTLSNSVAVSGNGVGVLPEVIMSDLEPGVQYHVRAWARNGAGVGYGYDVPFRTPYAVRASSSFYGTISPRGSIAVAEGSNVDFTIVARTNCEISDVIVDGVSVGATNGYAFMNVASNHTIRATFRSLAAGPIGPWAGACAVAGGLYHSLGLTSDGRVIAWGNNAYGQATGPNPNGDFVAVAGGGYHSLGMKSDGLIVAWGSDDSGQTSVPGANEDFVAVAAGYYHSLGLKSDGQVVVWGSNDSGQTNVPEPNMDFVAVACGGYHSLGLKSDGSIAAWGYGYYGQTNLPAENTGFIAVAGGGYHSLGLKADGSIVAWGNTNYDQTLVPAPNTGFVAIAAGSDHSLGLKSDGSIVAWGNTNHDQTLVPAPNTGFVAIAAGSDHSLGLKSDGSIVAWGGNYYGQTSVPAPNAGFGQPLGVVPHTGHVDGGTRVAIVGSFLSNGSDVTNVMLCGIAATIVTQSPGVVVVQTGPAPGPISGDVVLLSSQHWSLVRTNAFSYFAFPAVETRAVTNVTTTSALGSGEVLWDGGDAVIERGLCWSTATNPTVADLVAISGSGTGVFSDVTLGSLSPGTLYHVRAWARNVWGVGYGADVPFGTHFTVTASAGPHGTISPRGVFEVQYGESLVFTITPDAFCQVASLLVDGVSAGVTNRYVLADVTGNHIILVDFCGIGPWRGASGIAGGGYHSLGLKSDGQVLAWGRNDGGQTNVPGTNAAFVAVAGGGLHSLGLRWDGEIVAWGTNSSSQTNVPGPNADFVAVAAGANHSLGLKSDGRIVAWGLNTSGQTNVPGSNTSFVAVAGGGNHSLGLRSDGRIVAWGYGLNGQTNVPAPNADFVAVAGGFAHSLGLKSDGRVVAWGLNTSGQTNVPGSNTDFVAIAGGYSHSLGLKSDGRIVAWGSNADGQTNVPAPNADFVAVAAGNYHSLGLKSDGRVVVWGRNANGQTNVPSPNTGFGELSGVVPPAAPMSGGTRVTLLGFSLGNGSDITNVTLCGVPATIIGQSPSAIVVQSGPAASPLCGDVVVCSTGYGSITRTNAFAYFSTLTNFSFSVASDHGGATPDTGTHIRASGETLDCRVTNSPVASGGTQYVCVAGVVTGNDSTQVSPTNVTLTLTNDAALTWVWATQYWLAVEEGTNGHVIGESGSWHGMGGSVTVTAVPNACFRLAGWLGDVPSDLMHTNPLTLVMDQARSLSAEFTEMSGTNHGTPYTWLAKYGYTTDLDSAEVLTGSNGIPVWQSYVADLNPTDAASVFWINDASVWPTPTVYFRSSADRSYALEWSTGLMGNVGGFDTTSPSNTRGTGGTLSLSDTNAAGAAFYRVRVQTPP